MFSIQLNPAKLKEGRKNDFTRREKLISDFTDFSFTGMNFSGKSMASFPKNNNKMVLKSKQNIISKK